MKARPEETVASMHALFWATIHGAKREQRCTGPEKLIFNLCSALLPGRCLDRW